MSIFSGGRYKNVTTYIIDQTYYDYIRVYIIATDTRNNDNLFFRWKGNDWIVKKVEEGVRFDSLEGPSFCFSRDMAPLVKSLAQAFVEKGYAKEDGEPTTKEILRLENHLGDMRKIAFKKLQIEE
jgi:hypothetical protein